MATITPNIGLTKPEGTEKYDLDVVNANSDIIDAEITDAKAGSNIRVFKVKNDVSSVDNALNVQAGDGRYIRQSLSITAFIHLNYAHATDAVARFNQSGAGKIASFLQNGAEKSYIANDGSVWVAGKKLVNTDELQAVEDLAIANTTPVGTMIDFAGDTAPSGYLVCNGGEVSQTTYADLYAVLGVLWANTAGASTPAVGNFRLPPQQVDGLGLFNRGVGATNGDVGVYQVDVFKEHNHEVAGSNNSGIVLNAQGSSILARYIPTENTGDPTETRPRTITVLKCIKY